EALSERLAGVPGVQAPRHEPRARPTYWRYGVRVDGSQVPGGPVALGRLLAERGIASAPRYIQKPAFQCAVFRERRTFGQSQFPFTLARPEAIDYRPELFPGTFAALERILVLPWNEAYDTGHVDFIADSIRWGVRRLQEAG